MQFKFGDIVTPLTIENGALKPVPNKIGLVILSLNDKYLLSNGDLEMFSLVLFKDYITTYPNNLLRIKYRI